MVWGLPQKKTKNTSQQPPQKKGGVDAPDVRPYPNNTSKQYHILVTRKWTKTWARVLEFWLFSVLGFQGLRVYWFGKFQQRYPMQGFEYVKG
jgi:hypothetical protein